MAPRISTPRQAAFAVALSGLLGLAARRAVSSLLMSGAILSLSPRGGRP